MKRHVPWLERVALATIEHRLVIGLLAVGAFAWGLIVAPFDLSVPFLPRDPVPVDAIPDIGENQQIVFTEWSGRSPQDVEDQITYPLSVSLLGLPGVKSVRGQSMFGISSIYVIFEDDAEFYWSRSRILEKLASLAPGTLPEGVRPALGPDATALGQVFWYTLEGRDPSGRPTGGWDLQELRSIQDFQVRYALLAADGVAEVASIGGFVQEYQVDVDPDAMRAHRVSLEDVARAVSESNLEVGARTIEINRAEYMIRGTGFLEGVEDIERIAVAAREGIPVRLTDLAHVTLGPALRRGALDKGGAEAVGGVVVARHGSNPQQVIEGVKREIARLAPGLPLRVLPDGTESRVTVVPFYDRAGLIEETIATLGSAIFLQILVTVLVIVLMLWHLRSSLLVSGMLPAAVLLTFIAMKTAGVDANIVALSGIAIAVGTIVDMGIVLVENVVRRLEEDPAEDPRLVVARATGEIGPAVITAVLTTVIGFLPVFALEAAEGKLFRPLAFTKTFALLASILVAMLLVPPAAHLLLGRKRTHRVARLAGGVVLIAGGAGIAFVVSAWAGIAIALFGGVEVARFFVRAWPERESRLALIAVAALVVVVTLARAWQPLGPEAGLLANTLLVGLAVGSLLGIFALFQWSYPAMLAWALDHKILALAAPLVCVLFGLTAWLGAPRVLGWLPEDLRRTPPVVAAFHAFPGFGREFMPSLDEGSFLYMPTTMPHASIGEALALVEQLDRSILAIPEVRTVVGKIGRVESALDPAPISMIETIIDYHPEYARDAEGKLVRLWREEIRSPDDIWRSIVAAADILGVTSAPRLQPIETRLVMLQSGFRAPMGIRVHGPDLPTIEAAGLELERILKEVPKVEPSAVFADRVIGKPYLEIEPDRDALARYGISIRRFQEVIDVALGGKRLTTTVEGRERYPVRVRYQRERRDSIEAILQVLVPASGGRQIPLVEVAAIRYARGPEMIRSEDSFPVGYVIFDGRTGYAEVDVVRDAMSAVDAAIERGEWTVPPGVSIVFAGTWEQEQRASRKLALVIPLAMILIFVILHIHFRSSAMTLIVGTSVFVAWSGGFILMWLYGQPWFLNFSLFGANLRDLFQVGPIDLSVAVWVGFLALFGIATDDGVVMGTRLQQVLREERPATVADLRRATVEAGRLRIRACLMTTATTLLALLPVLTSTGRGADVMVPMAIPTFGGMTIELMTLFVVPVLVCFVEEARLTLRGRGASSPIEAALE